MEGEGLNRREFSALLPVLLASAGLMTAGITEGQATVKAEAGALGLAVAGKYEMQATHTPTAMRQSHSFLLGMLPDNIRLEAHFTHLAPGCPPEPVEHHKHSEMWCVHEGTVSLMTAGKVQTLKAGDFGLAPAGTEHSIYNASQTEPASYFVVAVGPVE